MPTPVTSATSSSSLAPAQKPTLRSGSRGTAVVDLQRRLAAAGFNPGPADGSFGPKTLAAVKAFQAARGLEVDGIVGPKTWGKLLAAPATSPSGASGTTGSGPTLRKGARGQAVTKLQQRLNQLGFGCGSADGVFGPKTLSAVKAFQSARHLAVDGVVGPKTWAALGITVSGGVTDPAPASGDLPWRVQKFINVAKAQTGDPYVFGAEGPNAFDCSGLIYYALRQAGVDVPRLTAAGYQQKYAGSKVGRSELKPGDLVFYWYPNDRGIRSGKASHIEIYLGNGMTMGTDNPREGARVEPIDWDHFIGGARVLQLYS